MVQWRVARAEGEERAASLISRLNPFIWIQQWTGVR